MIVGGPGGPILQPNPPKSLKEAYQLERPKSWPDAARTTADQPTRRSPPRYRKALWVALFINTLMFLVEIVGGLRSGSVSLLADAVDFAGDAANYGISLAVLSMGLLWRAWAAFLKGLSMGAYGVFTLGKTAWPDLAVAGVIAALALSASISVVRQARGEMARPAVAGG